MRNKLTVILGGLLFAWLAWISLRHAAPGKPGLQESLRPDVPYSLSVSNHQSIVDLEFGAVDAYRLIVSNFGAVDETVKVKVQAEPIDQLEPFSGERVAPLEIRPLMVRETADQAAAILTHPDTNNRVEPKVPADDRVEQILPVGYVAKAPERDFYLHVTEGAPENPEGYTRVVGVMIAQGAHSRVYLDRQEPQTATSLRLANELVQIYEEDVFPRTKATLGIHRDVDGDGKLALLLTPWLGKLQGGTTTLNGFTRSTDFRVGIAAPFSNQCDVIYLNSQLRPGPVLRDLLAHEYAHAVSFSIRQGATIHSVSLPDEEDWLNEGIAHLAENLAGSGWTNIDYRVSRFLDDPARYALIVPDYYRANLWREHGCRGATYLFLRWCADLWGDHLPAALIRSSTTGSVSLERLLGVPFPTLYRQFNLALAADSLVPGQRPVAGESGKSVLPLESVALYGRLGAWQLAGPRWNVIHVDETDSRELALRGTATAFVELRNGAQAGNRRIRIEGQPGSRLQLTLIRCRPDARSLNVTANWEKATDVAQGGTLPDSNSVGLLIDTAADSNRPLQIETVSLEQNFDETHRSIIAQPAGSVPSSGGAKRLRFVVPREIVSGITGTWQLKVIAQDPLGRRVTTLVTLPDRREVPTITASERPVTR